MTAKERTAWWIRHQPSTERYSPSAPPSDRGELEPDSQSVTAFDSDAESTHSVPPKMLLKYGDGRPDIPISHWHHEHNREPLSHSSGSPSNQSHRRSRSEQPVNRTISRSLHPRDSASMRHPEEIRVLPSRSSEAPRPASSQHHRRSKSQPRHGYSPPNEPAPPVPLYPSAQHTPQMINKPAPHHVYQTPVHPPAPQVAYSQTHPVYQGNPYASRYSENLPHHNRTPPSIVYAPGPHSRNHYAPPLLVHHQHGTPVPRFHYPGGQPFPSVQGGLASVNENMGNTGPRAARGHAPSHLDDSRSPTPSSQNSGSTYYVVPTPGQKVRVVTPDRSIYTATSTTQSPSPTHSGSSKKPFFSRFFHIAEKLASSDSQSRTSSSSGRRLHRRHSLGASAKGRPPIPNPPR